jgi:hypothetical protein
MGTATGNMMYYFLHKTKIITAATDSCLYPCCKEAFCSIAKPLFAALQSQFVQYCKLVLCILIMAGVFPCRSQTLKSLQWHDSLHTAKNVAYLTKTEKEVIHELNRVRTNPGAYALYLKEERQYYSGNNVVKPGELTLITREGLAAVDECIAVLEEARPVGMLYPHRELSDVAKWLAADQAKTGRTGHTGSGGRTLAQRMARYCTQSYITVGENISYSRKRTARQIVMQLLIDDGVPSRGHRNNILNAVFDCCGVAIDTHPVYGHLCVMDFAKFRNH